jgi:hypothetical protein
VAGVRRRGGGGRKVAGGKGRPYGSLMLKLVKVLLFAALLAGVVFLVPLEGKTLYQRWREAAPRAGRAEPRPPPEPGGKEAPARDRPLERTTESERKALDKLLEKELAEPPKR